MLNARLSMTCRQDTSTRSSVRSVVMTPVAIRTTLTPLARRWTSSSLFPRSTSYTFDLTQLGYKADEAVPVYDIWEKQSVGTATGTITAKVPSHGVKLYRLGDKIPSGINNVNVADKGSNVKVGLDGYYNLAGQKVNPAKKGIYIHNNKKVVVR